MSHDESVQLDRHVVGPDFGLVLNANRLSIITGSHSIDEESLMEDLADPVEAADYLTSSVEEGQEVFLLALRDVAKAQGGMAKLAELTEFPRESLYQMLSETGNPSLANISSVLEALGIHLQFVPAELAET